MNYVVKLKGGKNFWLIDVTKIHFKMSYRIYLLVFLFPESSNLSLKFLIVNTIVLRNVGI